MIPHSTGVELVELVSLLYSGTDGAGAWDLYFEDAHLADDGVAALRTAYFGLAAVG
jgi:hypothetical protein